MADGHRKYPIDYIVLHHSVGPEFKNSTDLKVQDWFDSTGKNRGYKGYSRSYHDHPQRNKETFAQAHFALREYTKDGNKYGWRLTYLMKDVWHNVAWHAGNWNINQRSIGIETCGRFDQGRKLPEKACMLIADFFRKHDKDIGGKLQITAHKQFSATACPGSIYNRRAMIVDMINNPKKWNDKLFPKPDKEETKFPKKGDKPKDSGKKKTTDCEKYIKEIKGLKEELAKEKAASNQLRLKNTKLKSEIDDLNAKLEMKNKKPSLLTILKKIFKK